MKNGEWTKLRYSNAAVGYYNELDIIDSNGCQRDLYNCYLLKSYDSIVAIYGETSDESKRLYLLPRYDYSITTLAHLRKFQEDYIGHVDNTPYLRKFGCKIKQFRYITRVKFHDRYDCIISEWRYY